MVIDHGDEKETSAVGVFSEGCRDLFVNEPDKVAGRYREFSQVIGASLTKSRPRTPFASPQFQSFLKKIIEKLAPLHMALVACCV